MAFTSTIWQQAAHTRTIISYLLNKSNTKTKKPNLQWKVLVNILGRGWENGLSEKKNDNQDRARGLGRKTREETGRGVKWQPSDSRQNQMAWLRGCFGVNILSHMQKNWIHWQVALHNLQRTATHIVPCGHVKTIRHSTSAGPLWGVLKGGHWDL